MRHRPSRRLPSVLTFALAFAGIAALAALAELPVAPPASAQETSAPEFVALRFDWPAGLAADVTTVRTRSRTTDAESTTRLTTSYRLRVEASADGGRTIGFDDPRVSLGDGEPVPQDPAMQAVAQAGGILPDFTVDAAGTFVGIRDLPGFRERVQALFDRMPAAIREMLTSEAFLEAQTAEEWNRLVGAWTGAELELEAVYGMESEEPLPMLAGEPVTMTYEIAVLGRVPCRRGGVERSCVELQLSSVADPDDVRALLESVQQRMLGDAAGPDAAAFESFSMRTDSRLITEPDGLIPHEASLTKTVEGTVTAAGQRQSILQVDTTETTFRYPAGR